MKRRTLPRLLLLLVASLLVGLPPAPVSAHAGRVALAFWGGFGPRFTACQRAIARATNLCAHAALRRRSRCDGGRTPPEACTPAALASALEESRRQVLDRITARCTERAAIQLGFLSVLEVEADLSAACRTADRVFADAVARAGEDPTCRRAIVDRLPLTLRLAQTRWEAAFNRMALRSLLPSLKRGRIAEARAGVSRRLTTTLGVIERECGESPGSRTDGLAAVASEAECLSGAAYVQDAVECDSRTLNAPR